MAVEKSYARLGLFLVVVLVVVLATAMLFIQRWRSRAVIELVTYTTENVSGLDVSSPVRFEECRLAASATCGWIRVTSSSKSTSKCFPIASARSASNAERIGEISDFLGVAPKLRASMVSNPVTGEAYLCSTCRRIRRRR